MCNVNLATGRLELSIEDFHIPGEVPLSMTRRYRSTNSFRGDLGYGWGHTWGVSLYREGGVLKFRGADGRRIPFDDPEADKPALQPTESSSLHFFRPEDVPWRELSTELQSGIFAVQIGSQETLIFDAQPFGNQYPWRGVANRNGKIALVFPAPNGEPATLVEPSGFTLLFLRGAGNLLREIQLASPGTASRRLSLVQFEYTADEDLAAVHDAAGTLHYQYKNHKLIRHRDRCGGECESEYDVKGRCVRTSGPNGVRFRKYAYDPEQHKTTVTDSMGCTSEYFYAPSEAVTKTIDPLGGVSQYDYDSENRLVLARDQIGEETRLCYSKDGSQRAIIRPDGSCDQVETSKLGDVIGIKSSAGVCYKYERDELGRLIRKTVPGLGTYKISYADDGSKQVTLPSGKEVFLKWSQDGRTVIESDELGVLTEQKFDMLRRLVHFRDAVGALTTYQYENSGHLSSIVRPDGSRRQFSYNAEGNLVAVEDETGQVTRWTYDTAGRCISVTKPDGGVLNFRYDSEDHLTGIQDLDGSWHLFFYDERGWLISQQFTDGRIEKYEYNARGDLLKMVNPDESVIAVDRDPCGRIQQIKYPDGSKKTVQNNPDGAWLRIERDGHVIERIVRPDKTATREGQDAFVVFRKYGDSGELLSVLDTLGRMVSYGYDENGRAVRVTVEHGTWQDESWSSNSDVRQHSFSYDRVGNLVTWSTPSGITELREYDMRRRLVDQRIVRDGTTIIRRQYSYDKAGRLVELTDTTSGTRRYRYDPSGRLIGQDATSFAYDSRGDLIRRGLSYEVGHRVSTTSTSRLRYNSMGFVEERSSALGIDRFSYLVHGQLRRAHLADGSEIVYEYDPHDRLVEKKANGTPESYCWNGEQLWVIQVGNKIHEYLYLPDNVSPFEQSAGSEHYSIHCDHRGKASFLIDSSGAIVWQAPVEPWGEVIGKKDVALPGAYLLFPGQVRDDSTSLCYNRYRFYFPESAHFLTPDPLGIWPAMDSYTYPLDPVNFIDPTGLKCRGKNDDPTLYRGDARPPDEVCKNGFVPKNPAATFSVVEHVEGPPPGSNWISTTHDINVAKRPVFAKGGYVYAIDNPGCGVEVDCEPKLIAKYGTDPADSEHEIAFNKAIPPANIKGFYPSDGKGGIGPFQACP